MNSWGIPGAVSPPGNFSAENSQPSCFEARKRIFDFIRNVYFCSVLNKIWTYRLMSVKVFRIKCYENPFSHSHAVIWLHSDWQSDLYRRSRDQNPPQGRCFTFQRLLICSRLCRYVKSYVMFEVCDFVLSGLS